MALSKWFLCGDEGYFEKEEGASTDVYRKGGSERVDERGVCDGVSSRGWGEEAD
jgi:hypothetical protein